MSSASPRASWPSTAPAASSEARSTPNPSAADSAEVKLLRKVLVLAALGALAGCGGGGGRKATAPSGAAGGATASTAPGLPVVNRARGVVQQQNQRSEQIDQQTGQADPVSGG